MELLHRAVGPIPTNLWVLADESSREAWSIDTATPCVAWLTGELAETGLDPQVRRGARTATGTTSATTRPWSNRPAPRLAAHVADRHGLERPDPLFRPLEVPPSVPALDLAEHDVIRFGDIRLEVLHTPGHTEGSDLPARQR